LRNQRPLDSPTGAQVTREGRTLWNFASNDYLGLDLRVAGEAEVVI
jgi:7-keto-8-aminopelargonate synthetase-like enzyme